MLRRSLLWVCFTCWPNYLQGDTSPVAPCGQKEQTRPFWHSCVPVAWGKAFHAPLFPQKHCHFSSQSLGNWDLFCSVLLYCESKDTVHFKVYDFFQEGRDKNDPHQYSKYLLFNYFGKQQNSYRLKKHLFLNKKVLRCITNLSTTVDFMIQLLLQNCQCENYCLLQKQNCDTH